MQTGDINGLSPNPFTWRWQFFLLVGKKENKTSSVRVCGCAFFVLNDAQLGCIMQWHQLALKQIHQKRIIREGISSIATYQLFHCPSVGSNNMLSSNYFFYICYHAGGSTKHLPRPKVKRRDEESSLNDASTPKKRGKMRTYLWACPSIPTPQPHHPSPCLYKI